MSKRKASPEPCTPKKTKYLAKFQPSWTVEFPWINQSKKGINYAFCTACRIDFKVGHSGKSDVLSHSETERHKCNIGSTKFNLKVSDMFAKKPETDSVTRAELKLF